MSRFLFLQRDFLRALIAIDAVIHQRVAGVEQFFYFIHSVAFFTAGNVISGENQIIDDRTGIRPAPEEIIIFKKGVVAVTGVRHDQRLHGDGIFFHQVGNAGIRVDHNFISQSLLTMLIQTFRLNELLPNDQCG